MEKEPIVNTVSLVSMTATFIMAILAYWMADHLYKKYTTTVADKWVMFWLIWDCMIHITIELPWVAISLISTVEEQTHWYFLLWKEYSKADLRWAVSDPTIIALESVSVATIPICIIVVYAICKRRYYRHWLQIVMSVCEFYGGWMCFVPDMLIGSPNLVTDHWLYLWVYLVFYNGIWVVAPAALCWQSWIHIKYAVIESGQAVDTVGILSHSSKSGQKKKI